MVKIVDFGILRWLPPNTYSESVPGTESAYDPQLVTLAEELRPDVDYHCSYNSPDLLEAIKRGSEDALVVVILAWCKRITHLTMTIPEFDVDDPQSLYIWVFRFATEVCFQSNYVHRGDEETSDLPLAQLQYVELMPGNPETPVYWKVVTPIIYLPKVKSLVAWRLCDAGFIKDIWEMATGAPEDDDDFFSAESRVSNVQALMLMNAGLSSEGLGELHYHLPGLKKLTVQPCNDYEYFDIPDSDDLAYDLAQYGESLEELDLNFNPIPGRCPHESSYPPFIPDPVAETVYRNCTQLRRLSCPMMGLFTDGDDSSDESGSESGRDYEITIVLDRLPKSIEYLKPRRRHFVEDWFHNRPPVKVYIDGFIELLREAAPGRRFSNLRVLDLSETFVDDPDTKGIDKMKELAEIQGIKLLLAER